MTLISQLFYSTIKDPGKVLLVVISLIGFVVFDVVYVMAVFNYGAQCEVNIKMLYSIQTMVEQKLYPDIDATIKVRSCSTSALVC